MTRHLYVPQGIAFDAQRDHAYKLISKKVEDQVTVHSHGTDGLCNDACTIFPDPANA